ncbi:MAG TPA: thiopurine S-methyltransferase [Rhodanobacteraceae bacterium]
MDNEFWLKRWREGRTGWHHDQPMPLLLQHWSALGVAPGTRVLVPLCGKSLDMLWLAQQGLRVLGADLSPIAIEAFLAEHRLHARSHAAADGTHFEVSNGPHGDGIELINGDLFKVDPATIASCGALYDRAASIALPRDQRERLARVYAQLRAGSRGLLITLDYPEAEMQGPPFSVDDVEVQRLYAADWQIEQLERRDILHSQPSFSENGVTALHTAVYALTRRSG